MNNPVEILVNKINNEKEILSVMPKNTKKNTTLYVEKVQEVKEDYNRYLNNIILEIKRRANRINNIKENPEIEKMQKRLSQLEKVNLFSSVNTSFEKMKLDENLFDLRRFYKNNLEQINNDIAECLTKFKEFGIKLTKNDFNYCPFVFKYMEKFFEEYENGNVNSQEMKENFEKIYWECSDLIVHIELNIRYLYMKNQKEIDKNSISINKKLLRELEISENDHLNKYKEIRQELDELKATDKRTILNKFINKEFDLKDYEEGTINKKYASILSEPPETYSKTEFNEIKDNILKLDKSIEEYKNYLEYKFVIDKVLKIYNEGDKYKGTYEKNKKQIQKLEAKLFATNKKYYKLVKRKKSALFNKNSDEKTKQIYADINAQILNIKEIYRQLDLDKANNKIISELTDNSTLYDALFLASGYYTFLVETIIEQFDGISEEEINKKIAEIREFITSPYLTILNNITIKEQKNIILMIKDKYNLFNLAISKNDFAENSIDVLSNTVNSIFNKCKLDSSKLDLDDIKYVMKANILLDEINSKSEG